MRGLYDDHHRANRTLDDVALALGEEMVARPAAV